MDGEFVSVKTWQGSIMVSTALLPQSFGEKTDMYSIENSTDSQPWRSDSLPRSQHQNSHAVTAPPPPPPVPNYWHHGPDAAITGNGFDSDAHLFDGAFSSSFNTAFSSYAPIYSPVYTPRTDDDAASIPEYPLFSPWESVAAGFPQQSPGVDWGDAVVATDSSLFAATADRCYCSVPPTGLLGQAWTDLMHHDSLEHEALFTLPSAWDHYECLGSTKRPNLDSGPVFFGR
ncbi:hypothetical protein E4U41_004598 [Claviceps citrina]|nr:hypothetical protein E4U41_004598 [Claviceps citrina]